MTYRVYNFNPGPATLPLPVLEEIQAELLDYRGTGMSIMETSHRSPEYSEIHAETKALFADLLGLGDDYHVLFLGGGASSQFFMAPMNLLGGRMRMTCSQLLENRPSVLCQPYWVSAGHLGLLMGMVLITMRCVSPSVVS